MATRKTTATKPDPTDVVPTATEIREAIAAWKAVPKSSTRRKTRQESAAWQRVYKNRVEAERSARVLQTRQAYEAAALANDYTDHAAEQRSVARYAQLAAQAVA